MGIPVTATSFSKVSQFVYDDGVLCFPCENGIRIINVVGSGDMTVSYEQALGDYAAGACEELMSLIHFCDSILTFVFRDSSSNDDYLFIFRVDWATSRAEPAVKPILLQEGSSGLFVRCTRDFVYYGTKTRLGSRGSYEWVIQGISLNPQKPFTKKSMSIREGAQSHESRFVTLNGFSGGEIGSQVAFKIHEDHFYAITNCDDFDVVEVDWTSMYRCMRFPLDDPDHDKVQTNDKLFRRQHREGPINDSWTNLSLQINEKTNEIMAVEARMEWLDGQSLQSRTFYISHINFPDSTEEKPVAPQNDPLTHLATSRSKYLESEPRAMWQVHQEDANILESCNNSKSPHNLAYIPAHTKMKAYNLSAGAFVDIVDDADCCPWDAKKDRRESCLRLRTGSRSIRSLQEATSEGFADKMRMLGIAEDTESNQVPVVLESDRFDLDSPNPYNYSKIKLWPEPLPGNDKSSKAHEIINPDTDDGYTYFSGVHVKGASDERSIVYLVRNAAAMQTSGTSVKGKLVILSFDQDANIGKWDMLSTSLAPKTSSLSLGSSIVSTEMCSPKRKLIEEGISHGRNKIPCVRRSGGDAWLMESFSLTPEGISLDLNDNGWRF